MRGSTLEDTSAARCRAGVTSGPPATAAFLPAYGLISFLPLRGRRANQAILAAALAMALAGCAARAKPQLPAAPAPPVPQAQPLSVPQTQVELPRPQPFNPDALATAPPVTGPPPAAPPTAPPRRPPHPPRPQAGFAAHGNRPASHSGDRAGRRTAATATLRPGSQTTGRPTPRAGAARQVVCVPTESGETHQPVRQALDRRRKSRRHALRR